MEVQWVKLQTQDHSNKLQISKNFKRSRYLSISSNVWELHSFHTNHIKHNGTTFQISEKCFPHQFLHLNKRDLTVRGIIHWIPNMLRTSHHSITSQWSSKWFTIFLPHHSTKEKSYLTRLLYPQTTVNKKKDTLRGLNTAYTLTRENITTGTMDILVIRLSTKLATPI